MVSYSPKHASWLFSDTTLCAYTTTLIAYECTTHQTMGLVLMIQSRMS